jgi:hypothetical protein
MVVSLLGMGFAYSEESRRGAEADHHRKRSWNKSKARQGCAPSRQDSLAKRDLRLFDFCQVLSNRHGTYGSNAARASALAWLLGMLALKIDGDGPPPILPPTVTRQTVLCFPKENQKD